jgi:uncharacterized protein YdeI (BOF family)
MKAKLVFLAAALPTCPVFANRNGKVIKDSYENGTYIGPAAVMAELEKLIKQ